MRVVLRLLLRLLLHPPIRPEHVPSAAPFHVFGVAIPPACLIRPTTSLRDQIDNLVLVLVLMIMACVKPVKTVKRNKGLYIEVIQRKVVRGTETRVIRCHICSRLCAYSHSKIPCRIIKGYISYIRLCRSKTRRGFTKVILE